MKFTPKPVDGSVNISGRHPLKEAVWLMAELLAVLALLYFVLGLIAGFVAVRLPVKAEIWLGSKLEKKYKAHRKEFLQDHLDRLVQVLPADSPLHEYSFKIFLDDSKKINAFALPGGSIVVFQGLLNTVRSENELDMVLAHELGHFYHRDHLRAMGRNLLFFLVSRMLPGDQSSDLVPWLAGKFERRYSQKQELAADSWGLDLLYRRYGHVGGATDFFNRLSRKKKSHFAYFLATHPHPEDRLTNLHRIIKDRNYPVRETVPFQPDQKKNLENQG
ncbi:M48 family metallopeptidase [Desulfomarina sp.]